MNDTDRTSTAYPDLFTLAAGPMSAITAALEAAADVQDQDAVVPPRAVQLADLIRSKTVRLIRLGTPAETEEAAIDLLEVVTGSVGDRLQDNHPEALDVAKAASITLAGAIGPSNSAGELAVLRSWNGLALKVVTALSYAEGRSLPRTELRARFGLEESPLSPLLADLEAIGLVVRIREGRNVQVHLGPAGRTDHVQKVVDGESPPDVEEAKRIVEETLWALVRDEEVAAAPGLDRVRAQVQAVRQRLDDDHPTVELIAEGGTVVCVSHFRNLVLLHSGLIAEEDARATLVWLGRVADGRVISADVLSAAPENARLPQPASPFRHQVGFKETLPIRSEQEELDLRLGAPPIFLAAHHNASLISRDQVQAAVRQQGQRNVDILNRREPTKSIYMRMQLPPSLPESDGDKPEPPCRQSAAALND